MQALSAGSTVIDIRIKVIAGGPSKMAKCYKGHMINGLRFHTKEFGRGRKTMNSGVRVKGSCGDNYERDFYGMLIDIVELSYMGGLCTTLFKCHWYDSENHLKVNKYGIIDINYKSCLASDEPFILASQANQVYYAPYASRTRELNDWWAVLNIKARSTYNISMPQNQGDNNEEYIVNDIYQEDNMGPHNVIEETEELFGLRGVGEEIVLDTVQNGQEEEEEFEEENDSEEDDFETSSDEEEEEIEGDDEDEENEDDH